jgi:lariat debranching enzyme
MLLHEWPKGLVTRKRLAQPLRAQRFPWIGNAASRLLVESVRPRWLWCGHSHVPLATTVEHPDGTRTYVACLDQAARPEGAIVWVEWEAGAPVRAGWGISGETAWTSGQKWDESLTPKEAPSEPAADAMQQGS